MPLTCVTVPCLADNYAYLLHDAASGATALIDAPEAAPIRAALQARDWRLSQIVLTHHHADHVQAVAELRAGAEVIGAADDAPRLPPLDLCVGDGDTVTLAGAQAQVIAVPGHTSGHIALYLPEERALFTADSLMTMGCGRLFEGSPAQMWASLTRLRALPGDTRVYTGHEYTATNIAFAQSLGEANPALDARAAAVAAARAEKRPTTGATLAEEAATNPFLRADSATLAAAIGMAGADPLAVFTAIRARRDAW